VPGRASPPDRSPSLHYPPLTGPAIPRFPG
jgi:hypothetical protein